MCLCWNHASVGFPPLRELSKRGALTTCQFGSHVFFVRPFQRPPLLSSFEFLKLCWEEGKRAFDKKNTCISDFIFGFFVMI